MNGDWPLFPELFPDIENKELKTYLNKLKVELIQFQVRVIKKNIQVVKLLRVQVVNINVEQVCVHEKNERNDANKG